MRKSNLLRKGAAFVGTAGSMVAGAASAATDVTATTTAISDAVTTVGLIGVAVLGVYVAIKTYKWIRRAM